MGTFDASLRAIGDVNSVPATVEVDNGTIKIAAGSVDIGSWPLQEVHLEPVPTGYRMAAEGDQILIEMNDVDAFSAAIQTKQSRFKKERVVKERPPKEQSPKEKKARARVGRAKKTKTPKSEPAAPSIEVVEQAKTKPKKSKPAKTTAKTPVIERVDGFIASGSKKYGAYLPSWVFSRAMLALGVIALILMLVFPGGMSLLLVAAGVLVILYGAVCYSDPMLASRWLPGRTQPPHVLIAGLGVLFLGILLGLLPY